MAVILNIVQILKSANPLRIVIYSLFLLQVFGQNFVVGSEEAKDDDDLCPAIASEGWGLPEKPVQLVKPDLTHKKLVIVEENVKFLHKIMGPVATIAVVGKYHSGKSFLMNQLMGKSRGFGVGFTVKPQTMGIWMWGRPIDMVLSNGKNVSVIFLDTEGFAANNISENYDAKIFAISTLLSSQLIYNSVKIIDQADIDYLELLARRTQLFALRSQMSKAKWTEFNHDLLTFPPLLWVVQDFVQVKEEGQTPQDWLHALMDTHTREAEDYEISLLGIFKSVDCHTLFLPSADKVLLSDLSMAEEKDFTADYRNDRDDLIVKMQAELVPKEKNHKGVTGPELATLLEILVTGANDGSLAEVPSRWDVFISRLEETAVEDCYRFYAAEMETLSRKLNAGPVKPGQLEKWHHQSLKQSMKLLNQLLYGLGDSIQQASRTLTGTINTEYIRNRDFNEKKIRLKCSEKQKELELFVEEKFGQVILPVKSKILQALGVELTNSTEKRFSEAVKDFVSNDILESYLKALHTFTQSVTDSNTIKNQELLDVFLKQCIVQGVDLFRDETRNEDQLPRKPEVLDAIITEAKEKSIEFFIKLASIAQEEATFTAYRALFSNEIADASKDIYEENEKFVVAEGKKIVNTLLNTFEEATAAIKLILPMNTTELDNRLERDAKRILNAFDEYIHPYLQYNIANGVTVLLKDGIENLNKKRRDENVEAFTKEVSTPLNMAKQIILLSADKFTTLFSLKQYMLDVCLLNLNEGKAKFWPYDFKLSIIEHYVAMDRELTSLVESRQSVWSSFIGFFQWLAWILNI